MMQGTSQSYYTNIKAGADLIQTLSESLYKNAYYVFDELISNAYDADATKVKISVADDEIILFDNGDGMDKDGLEHYLWLGYSDKQRDRTTKRLKRFTIGKFGIGKLSMHVMCDRCQIETTRKGIKRTLILDFGSVLSYKGLSDEQIEVIETLAKKGEHGTTIRLIGLKKKIDKDRAIKRIIRNMPLSQNFQVQFNNKILKPEDIVKGRKFKISLDLPLAGKVHGKLVYSDVPLGDFAGVYVKVHVRTVNADEPNLLGLFNLVRCPETFLARLYCVVSANRLDDIILANRNGFKEDSPKFLEFRQAILKEIRRMTSEIGSIQSQEEVQYEDQLLGDIIKNQIKKLFLGADLQEGFLIRYQRHENPRVKRLIEKIERQKAKQTEYRESRINRVSEKDRIIRIGTKHFKFELANIGREAYECILDSQKAIFYINIDHPQYLFSRKEGSLSHHFRRVIVFEVAYLMSGELADELVTQYQNMMQQNIDVQEEA